ncbi:MAG: hypothetical protein ACYCVT_13400 [Acidithiobacillus ferrooxidans]|jgi:hypothetical protein|uniref:Uncharacterized protein n=1 Tax=Acidithiobacillus ferruginosus TaxID=3063951 RepID=A0ACD5IJZ9_9PROT|nr:hypothetical protein [Acidithiobacillus ferruginosus]
MDLHFLVHGGIPKGDVLITYPGLFCPGKSNFIAIERYRQL